MLKRLATIMIRPRETMREILDAAGSRRVIPIVLVASLSAMAGDFDDRSFRHALRQEGYIALIAAVVIIATTLLILGLLYLIAWVAQLIGRQVLEGTGTVADVRAALAWGMVPAIWALLYRIPVLFLVKREHVDFGAEAGFRISRISEGCWTGLLLATLELIAFIWAVIVTSNTLGEAHRFSSWRGLATLAMTCAVPFVIIIAAVLAMR
ncbi:MAG TPA: YIP1 family protein [Thermoanaerobaculia bacterium]|nr:YIP1 family protein [Thermoanaerobaculia bacterium]